MRPILVAALLTFTTLATAQDSVPERVLERAAELRDRALEANDAYETLSSLVTEIGPRFAGTAGDTAATAWALRTLREAGLQRVRLEAVTVPRWVRGETTVEITAPFPQTLVAVALGHSVGTPAGGVEAPVLRVADIADLKGTPAAEVAGRIVFFDKRMERLQDGSGYGKTVPARSSGPAEAARLGAVGVVIRSVGTSDERIAHTGMTRYADDAPRIPAVAISNPDADLLARQVATGRAVTLRVESSARELGPTRSANVIGEIPGRGPNADEIVLLAAHLDSWDITPGAHDDGAGVAIVTEVARMIAAARRDPPRRTVRVLLAANEEAGLDGAKAYAAAHADEIERHVIAIEADAGAGRVWGMRSGVAESALPAIESLAALLEPLGVQYGDNGGRGGADLRPIRELGVPTIDLRHDMRVYFDVHHTINDTLAKIDRDELDQSVAAYAAFAVFAAYSDVDFGRHPNPKPVP